MSDRVERAREQGVTVGKSVADDAIASLDAAVSDQLLAVLGSEGAVHQELVTALADRAVEALDDDDVAAIIQQDRLAVLGAKAAPAGVWRDRRDPDAPVTIGDVVRATLARIIRKPSLGTDPRARLGVPAERVSVSPPNRSCSPSTNCSTLVRAKPTSRTRRSTASRTRSTCRADTGQSLKATLRALKFTALEQFAAVDEPGAEPLARGARAAP